MARKWAIAVGINQYQRLQPLRYAERDAQAFRDFLIGDTGFDQVYSFSDRSPKIILEGVSISTQPTIANLRRFFELRFAAPFLKQGDTLWFFFSGYGLQYANADYLLPSDVDPDAAETTAMTVDALADYLSRSGTDQIVLFLDACRTEEQKFGQGFGTDPNGVISLFSTSLGETAQELEAVHLGAFAHVLLEGLQLKSSKPNATLTQLFQYLYDRLPQVNLSYSKPTQLPRLSSHASVAPEAMLLPHIASRGDKLSARAKPPITRQTLAIARQPFKKVLQAGVASISVLVLGFVAITAYRELAQRYVNAPEIEAATVASAVPSPATFSLKNNFYQRLPRPGKYTAIISPFSQSYREISSGNGHFCIKLVNAPAKASSNQQIIVSTLSFRSDGVYIDATRERLQIDGTFTEVTDSKSTWQWLKNEVDRSGLVGECLASTTNYVREVKGVAQK